MNLRSGGGKTVVIIGAGPAGLTVAYRLQKLSPDHVPEVYEASGMVGGISRTESKNGNRFDIGGHRFFTKVAEVERMWHEVLEGDFITVPRLSRIYYQGKFYSYPLKLFNALSNIGAYEAFRIVMSYMKWQVKPAGKEETFEDTRGRRADLLRQLRELPWRRRERHHRHRRAEPHRRRLDLRR